jgi:pyridoxal 5'-phosphate synthase pdxT subunit
VNIGVLALQGGFRNHVEALQRCGATTHEIRQVEQLSVIDALVIPGGESGAISKLMATFGFFDAFAKRPVPVLGTCAGTILSARNIEDGLTGQQSLQIFDATVRRNALGSQKMSHELQMGISGLDGEFRGVFIRPPVIESVGDGVEVLARVSDKPVLCKQGQNMFATFHPELTGDGRIHELFLNQLTER